MRLMIAAVALCCFAVPAFAQGGQMAENFPDTEFGDWTFYGFDTDCWMRHEIDGDSDEPGEIVLSTGKEPQFYLQLNDPKWKAEPNRDYIANLQFGTAGFAVTGQATDNTLAAIADAPEDRYLGALANGGMLSISIDRYRLRLPLPEDPAAYAWLRKCVAAAIKLKD
jgi:hypothetical protein